MRALLFDAQMIHTYAPYSVIRAAVENACEAMWLLHPTSRPQRIKHCLKRAYENVRQSQEFMELAKITPPSRTHAERVQEIRDYSLANGVDPHGVCGRWSATVPLRYVDREVLGGSDMAEALWRICSGFTHGREWATLGLLERAVQSTAGNVANVRLSSSGETLLDMLCGATVLTGQAKQLYDVRRRSHR
ncbi:hypothetical protein ACIBL6_20395 [Streptomyces sp. NPDC050400]|uniref:hypothetical protein n=1 Tax=Streptomyces sp. NPDC050400 TaxID=3365610 RepID=UPI00379A4E6D